MDISRRFKIWTKFVPIFFFFSKICKNNDDTVCLYIPAKGVVPLHIISILRRDFYYYIILLTLVVWNISHIRPLGYNIYMLADQNWQLFE